MKWDNSFGSLSNKIEIFMCSCGYGLEGEPPGSSVCSVTVDAFARRIYSAPFISSSFAGDGDLLRLFEAAWW